MKHTPGKWEVTDCKDSAIKIAKRRFEKPMIPIIDKIQVELEIEANARLIVSAPKLLEACKEMLVNLLAYQQKLPNIKCSEYVKWEQAIAKAEGNQ